MAEIRFDSLVIPGKCDNSFESLEATSQDASLSLIKPCVILSGQLDTLEVTDSSPVAPTHASPYSSVSCTPADGRQCGTENPINSEVFRITKRVCRMARRRKGELPRYRLHK
jgi:hypothetical protein